MNEKLNIQDLSVILAKQRGLEKEKAENFVREFFALIGEALETDKYLKIKGFGVFKLIEVESRESVNIQTKERFEIPGYTKISFTPDALLKDTINQPFAIFETVILNENTTFEEKNIGSVDELKDTGEEAEENNMVHFENLPESFSKSDMPERKSDEDHKRVGDVTEETVHAEDSQPHFFFSHLYRWALKRVFSICVIVSLIAVLIGLIVLFIYI